MKPQLNHLIVWASDRRAAAQFFCDIAGMGPPTEFGHFTQVETGNGVTLDFADTNVGWEIITRPYGSGPDERQTNG